MTHWLSVVLQGRTVELPINLITVIIYPPILLLSQLYRVKFEFVRV